MTDIARDIARVLVDYILDDPLNMDIASIHRRTEAIVIEWHLMGMENKKVHDPIKDKPAIEPMKEREMVESIFTLIKLLDLEWRKLESFYPNYARDIDYAYNMRNYINQLCMCISNMRVNEERNKK